MHALVDFSKTEQRLWLFYLQESIKKKADRKDSCSIGTILQQSSVVVIVALAAEIELTTESTNCNSFVVSSQIRFVNSA